MGELTFQKGWRVKSSEKCEDMKIRCLVKEQKYILKSEKLLDWNPLFIVIKSIKKIVNRNTCIHFHSLLSELPDPILKFLISIWSDTHLIIFKNKPFFSSTLINLSTSLLQSPFSILSTTSCVIFQSGEKSLLISFELSSV